MTTTRLLTAARKLDIDTDVALTATRDVVLDTDDEEQLASKCADVELVLGDDITSGPGVLHLTTRRVVWVSADPSGPALALHYPAIVMHAVSRDPASYARPCLYLQLDDGSEDMMEAGAAAEEEGEEEEEVAAEVRLVPAEEGRVDELFKVLCDCAALNPDSEVEGEGDFYFDEAEVLAGLDPDTRAAVIADRLGAGMELEEGEGVENGGEGELQELMGDDPSRFEDEEEEEEQHPTSNGPSSGR